MVFISCSNKCVEFSLRKKKLSRFSNLLFNTLFILLFPVFQKVFWIQIILTWIRILYPDIDLVGSKALVPSNRVLIFTTKIFINVMYFPQLNFPSSNFPNINLPNSNFPQQQLSPTATSPTTISPSSKIYNFPNVKNSCIFLSSLAATLGP